MPSHRGLGIESVAWHGRNGMHAVDEGERPAGCFGQLESPRRGSQPCKLHECVFAVPDILSSMFWDKWHGW